MWWLFFNQNLCSIPPYYNQSCLKHFIAKLQSNMVFHLVINIMS